MLKMQIGLVLMIFPVLLQAQIVMNIQFPPSGIVQKDQLWNLVLTNNTTTEFETKLLFNLQDVTNGRSVMTASTTSFPLEKGMKVLTAKDVQPVQYNYATSAPVFDYLPLGSYIACYTLYRVRMDAAEKLAEECVRINITPLSPPQLVTPLDKSVLGKGAPQLTWMAPAPLDMFNDLTYELNLAEVLPGQSEAQAIQYNTSVYTRSGLKSTFENYPGSSSPLEQGKTYAWQVTASNNDSYRASTEVWTFSISGDSTVSENSTLPYVLLNSKKEESGTSYVKDSVYIKYYSFDNAHETVLRFYTADATLLEERKQTVHYGNNFLRLPLGRHYKKGQLYHLELHDLNGKSYSTFFAIK